MIRSALRIWQGFQQDCVNHREDSGVGADTQRQRRNRDGREARTLPEYAKGVPQIGDEILHALITIEGAKEFHDSGSRTPTLSPRMRRRGASTARPITPGGAR